MAELTEYDKDRLHSVMDVALALDRSWPGIASWNLAVARERGESTRVWLKRWKENR